MPSRMPSAIAGAISSVATKVEMPISAPGRSTFHANTSGFTRIRLNTAIITITASTACGR